MVDGIHLLRREILLIDELQPCERGAVIQVELPRQFALAVADLHIFLICRLISGEDRLVGFAPALDIGDLNHSPFTMQLAVHESTRKITHADRRDRHHSGRLLKMPGQSEDGAGNKLFGFDGLSMGLRDRFRLRVVDQKQIGTLLLIHQPLNRATH